MFSGEIVAPFGETSQPRLENSGIRNCLQGVRKEERKKDRLIEGQHLRLPRFAFSIRPFSSSSATLGKIATVI